MIVVTGAAGFIGSCLVSRLNQLGRDDIIAVDEFKESKEGNLQGKRVVSKIDKHDFLNSVNQPQGLNNVDAIIHMGACSSTTLQDKDYFEVNNYMYTKILANAAIEKSIRFIYASSAATYGDGSLGYNDDENTTRQCVPLNLYGMSKQKFDLYALENNFLNKIVGLKFFNVFGPNEYHKKDMRSVVAKAFAKVDEEGAMSLFKSYKEEYGDGEQKRDFIYVKDAVDVVIYFLENKNLFGIYNVGTGKARTWNDLANALFKALGKPANIKYMEMPETLRAMYQYFTQADMRKLKDSGYTKSFTSLEDAVCDYSNYLKETGYY